MSEDLFDLQSPVPRKEAVLLGPADDWRSNAYLNIGSWDAYATGYRQAADLLVDAYCRGPDVPSDLNDAIRKETLVPDLLVFPIAFLYRQYIELRLKEIVAEGTSYLGRPCPNLTGKEGHDLTWLWRHARPVLEEILPEDYGYYDAIEGNIKEFAAVDPRSDSFRYPTDKAGQDSLPKMDVNLPQMRETMHGIASMLDGSSIGLYEMQQGVD